MGEALEYALWTTEEEVDPESCKEQVTFKEVIADCERADVCLWEGECWAGRGVGEGIPEKRKVPTAQEKAQ